MKRKFLWLLLAIVVILAGAPFLNADRFGPRIQTGLEKALGRKVEIGAVRLHFLTGPGFSVRKVVIHERPEVSAEPFAYVDDLVVRIRLLSLLSGKFEFSSLRLDKPHVNLMRQSNGAWNVQALLAPPPPAAGAAAGPAPAAMPELEVRRGRLNFKLEDRKSAYYFTDADIDFSAVADGNFDIWFVGEMARTDRMARGLGRVTARGRLRDTGAEPKLDLDVQLERSALQELAQLIGSRDPGVHGVVKSRAQVTGPVSALEIKGQLDLNELHHWTQPPRAASVSVSYTGQLRLGDQSLRLETDPKRQLRASVRIDRFLTQTQWQVEVVAENLSMEPMAEWLRPPGADFNGMKLAGSISGQLRVAQDTPAAGSGTLTALDWNWGDGSRLEAAQLEAAVADGAIRLAPAALTLDGQPLQVECDWRIAEPAWECRGSSRGQDVKRLQRWMKALGLRAEWVEDLTAGQLRGNLSVSQTGTEPPVWKGQLDLRNAEIPVPELAAPVKIAGATVVWQQERFIIPALRATAGGVAWTGSYRYESGAPRPHRVTLEAGEVEWSDFERLLSGMAKGGGILSRALGMGEKREVAAAECTLHAKRIGVASNVHATIFRETDRVAIPAVSGDLLGGKWKGSGALRGRADLDLSGKLTGLAWEDAVVESDWKLTFRNRLTLQGVAKAAGGPAESLQASYKWEIPGGIQLTSLEAQIAGKRVPGRAAGPAEGPLSVEFGDTLKFKLTLQPFAVAAEPR